jgi:chaperonin GroEL
MDKNGVNISIEYTKDGHTIVKNILFINPIERSVQDLLTDLTREIVKEVGDGTTSAIILCKTIFDALCEDESIKDLPPSDVIALFNEAVAEVSEAVKSQAKECTLDDIYDIALISTNNNEDVAAIIRNIYEKFGMDVLIDVGISNEVDNLVKEYDGMVLETGFTDICFVNEKEKNRASIRNPKIYCFNDPIDTPEMLSLLDKILYTNILQHYTQGSNSNPVPTVIFGRAISPDTSSYFESIVKLMNAYPGQVPLLMVTDITQYYLYEDIAKMCGAPFIKKYINPDLQAQDVEKGLAPTIETVCDFCGSAELVQSDQLKTKIINPAKMFNEDGSYSDLYNTMLNYLETQVEKATTDNAGIEQIARTKRRLYSFKGNMVDFLIGGITLADRNNLKASVEDAVLNCRSAATNGVGYGANYMAWRYLYGIESSNNPIIPILKNAYNKLMGILYSFTCPTENDLETFLEIMYTEGCPLNIRTMDYDFTVKSSIKSDIVILETINRILTLMFTCNQYLVQTPAHNQYIDAK